MKALLVLTIISMLFVSSLAMSHSDAVSHLSKHGIGIRSSGNCSNRNIPTCTSLDGIKNHVITGKASIIVLKNASKCPITITGGTEVGHAKGTYSHENGYKLDVAMNACLTNYIKASFTPIGGNKWRAASGNIYYNEINHWDITFMP